jgi:hypothetical protein
MPPPATRAPAAHAQRAPLKSAPRSASAPPLLEGTRPNSAATSAATSSRTCSNGLAFASAAGRRGRDASRAHTPRGRGSGAQRERTALGVRSARRAGAGGTRACLRAVLVGRLQQVGEGGVRLLLRGGQARLRARIRPRTLRRCGPRAAHPGAALLGARARARADTRRRGRGAPRLRYRGLRRAAGAHAAGRRRLQNCAVGRCRGW